MSGLLAALRLLTVIPLGEGVSSPSAIRRSPAFFPVVGLGVGGLMAGVNWLALQGLPALPSAALALAAGVAVTGALHIDGLADTFDGLFGGHTPERRLEIMKDPRHGTFGIGAIALDLLLKWSVIAAMPGPHAWAAIMAGPVAGRLAAVAVMATFPYTRAGGIGRPYGRGGWALAAAAVLTGVICYLLLGPWGPAVVAAAAAVALLAAWFASSRLGGGVTGDVYGAAIEISEVASLLLFAWLLESALAVGPVWS